MNFTNTKMVFGGFVRTVKDVVILVIKNDGNILVKKLILQGEYIENLMENK